MFMEHKILKMVCDFPGCNSDCNIQTCAICGKAFCNKHSVYFQMHRDTYPNSRAQARAVCGMCAGRPIADLVHSTIPADRWFSEVQKEAERLDMPTR